MIKLPKPQPAVVPATILLVEDAQYDMMVLVRTFEQTGIDNPLVQIFDGATAVDYLLGNGEYSDRALYPIPLILILDLHMPGLNGFDVLEQAGTVLREHNVHVLVLSGSDMPEEQQRALRLGAQLWIHKPIAPESLLDAISQVTGLRLLLAPENLPGSA